MPLCIIAAPSPSIRSNRPQRSKTKISIDHERGIRAVLQEDRVDATIDQVDLPSVLPAPPRLARIQRMRDQRDDLRRSEPQLKHVAVSNRIAVEVMSDAAAVFLA